jgi:hypothetical protein
VPSSTLEFAKTKARQSQKNKEPGSDEPGSLSCIRTLPDDFQANLNLTRLEAAGRIQFPRRAGSKSSGTAENCFVVDRRQIIGVIQNVEELRAELDVETLRDPADVVVFEYHEIEIREARPNQGIYIGRAHV